MKINITLNPEVSSAPSPSILLTNRRPGMRTFFSYYAALALLCAFSTRWTALAGIPESSPNLLAAEKALEAAKSADDPNPSLQEALKDLNKATNNAGDYKDKAISLVKEAVDFAKSGDKDQMKEKIDHAIFDLNGGMQRGGRRRR